MKETLSENIEEDMVEVQAKKEQFFYDTLKSITPLSLRIPFQKAKNV